MEHNDADYGYGQQADDSSSTTYEKNKDWKKRPSLEDLKGEYSLGRNDTQTQVAKIGGWLDQLHIEGKAKPKKVPGRSSHQPRMIRKQAEWRYSSLSDPFLSTPDLFNVRPAGSMDRDSAYANQLILNHQFNTKIDKVAFIGEYIRTLVDEGTVVVKLGWEFEEGERLVEEPVFAQQPVQDPQTGAVVLQTIQVGTQSVKKVVTVTNNPTVEVCDYRNITIDPSCKGDLDKARFISHEFETSKAELLKEGDKYFNLDKVNYAEQSVLAQPDHEFQDRTVFNFKDDLRKRVVAVEHYSYSDINDTGILVPIVTTWIGNTIVRQEEIPFPDKKLPFVKAVYMPVRKSNYGEPDAVLLEENQKIVGAVTRGVIDSMARTASGQVGYRAGSLDITNRRRMEMGLDYEFNGSVDPRQIFHVHQFPELPQSSQIILQMFNAEAESLTGVKAFNNGISGQSLGDVAAGIRGALDAASKRELDILRRAASGLVKLGRKIIAMNAEFLEEEEVVRITDDEHLTIKRDALAGNFDLELSISTAEEDNAKAQELAFMLQTLGNNAPFELVQMILSEIARLRKMPHLAKTIQEYKPQPDPIAQQKAMLEVKLLEQQILKEQALTAQIMQGKLPLDQAKVGTEQARAELYLAQSDNTELNTMEQEMGVSHARRMDEMAGQAKGNAQLEVVKAAVANQQKDSPK